MPFAPFYNYFPEIAERETRSIDVLPGARSDLPVGSYGFIEMYCDERGCDCRRVFFYVVRRTREKPEAVVAYGWETAEFYAKWLRDDDPEMIAAMQGPILNPGSPCSRLAPGILKMVRGVLLRDDAYVERIKRHYAMFRGKVDGKTTGPTRKGRRATQQRAKRKRKKR